MTPLLSVENLEVRFPSPRGETVCVEALSFALDPGGTLGVVGESGSGKSLSVLALLGLLPGARVSGRALFRGEDLLTLPPRRLQALRGRRLSMIFQDPMTSLNPGHTIGEQLMEGPRLHLGLGRTQARTLALDWLVQVGVPAPEARFRQYPAELSGGLRQRVLIAMALACGPDLLIADEPTTALDVTLQGQILDLIQAQQRQRGMALILVSHDLAVVADSCRHLRVMYAGRAVEEGPTRAVLAGPRHPYTAGLIRSGAFPDRPREPLPELPGQVPDPGLPAAGCRFRDRCPLAAGACREEPALTGGPERRWRCHFPLGAP